MDDREMPAAAMNAGQDESEMPCSGNADDVAYRTHELVRESFLFRPDVDVATHGLLSPEPGARLSASHQHPMFARRPVRDGVCAGRHFRVGG